MYKPTEKDNLTIVLDLLINYFLTSAKENQDRFSSSDGLPSAAHSRQEPRHAYNGRLSDAKLAGTLLPHRA